MRKSLDDERGNAAIYLIWLLGIVSIIFLIVINISKVYITGAQSSNATEQAAIAGTSVIVSETKTAIEKFDANPLSDLTRAHHNMKSMGDVIEDQKDSYEDTGLSEDQAYIKALNHVLPEEIDAHPLLENTIKEHFISVGLNNRIYSTVTSIIEENHGNAADTQVILSDEDWRLEVESSVDYNSISDQKYIPEITEKIEGEGFGPTLEYLSRLY
ncbi:hypothetical protein [Oceanobacillus salinisoli]|uniref:hypothetical protein n=1 Tax=Oceanobacillus salinisoli TaxID=2678611 RepID=UPI0012E1DA45|nr:hypothetical protein [Oceanobacillus salinisoli]